MQALQRVQRSTKQDMQLARKQLHLAKAQLAEVRRTAHSNPKSAPGFCADINRNLMVPVPSKPVEVSNTLPCDDLRIGCFDRGCMTWQLRGTLGHCMV